MVDANFQMLGQPSFWLGLVFVLALAAVPLWLAWRMLNGRYRRWTIAPSIPFQISTRNTWPFMLLCFGLAIVVVLPTIWFEIIGWEDARQFMWAVPFWIPWVGVILSFVYWPVVLAPKWYRDWVRHPDYPDVSPWRPEEVTSVLEMEPGPAQTRQLKDMEWCGIDVDAAWKQAGKPGRPPESRFEKKVRSVAEERTAAGMEDGQDLAEQVARLREHRQREKAAKKAARQAQRSD
jgi:hypothetical protein